MLSAGVCKAVGRAVPLGCFFEKTSNCHVLFAPKTGAKGGGRRQPPCRFTPCTKLYGSC